MTLEEFLAWEERQELRHEFDGVRPLLRDGVTVGHSLIQVNLVAGLGRRLRGKRCQAFGSNLKICVAGNVRYPDAFIACSRYPRGTIVIHDPVVVFEIVAPDTATTDRIVKNQEYRDTPSIQRYVMLEQDRQAATIFARVGDDWVGHVVSGNVVLAMPEIGIEVPLAELYEGVEFSEPTEATE